MESTLGFSSDLKDEINIESTLMLARATEGGTFTTVSMLSVLCQSGSDKTVKPVFSCTRFLSKVKDEFYQK